MMIKGWMKIQPFIFWLIIDYQLYIIYMNHENNIY